MLHKCGSNSRTYSRQWEWQDQGRTGPAVGQDQGLGSGPKARSHSCNVPAAPFCPLPPAFIFGGHPEHSCVIAVAQCSGRTHEHMHAHTMPPIFSCLLYFPIPPSRKMRSLHSWRLLLLTEQMGHSGQLLYHTATADTYRGAKCRKNTHVLPTGFPHLALSDVYLVQ